jgi:hypothetical protein
MIANMGIKTVNVERGTGHRHDYAVAPTKDQLERYLDRGLTQQQIADAWYEDSGERVSRTTIAMAIKRYELKSSRTRPRYEDVLPWRVRVQHRQAYDAQMLRLEGRRRHGHPMNPRQKAELTNWLRRLKEADAVVAYSPDTEEGFFWVVRTPADDDIIRRETI